MHTQTHTQANAHNHTYRNANTRKRTHTHSHARTHTHTHARTHTHTRTHAHTRTHTHTHNLQDFLATRPSDSLGQCGQSVSRVTAACGQEMTDGQLTNRGQIPVASVDCFRCSDLRLANVAHQIRCSINVVVLQATAQADLAATKDSSLGQMTNSRCLCRYVPIDCVLVQKSLFFSKDLRVLGGLRQEQIT